MQKAVAENRAPRHCADRNCGIFRLAARTSRAGILVSCSATRAAPYARSDRPIDPCRGGVGRLGSRRPPGRSLGGRAVPPSRRRCRRSPGRGPRAPSRARRRPRRDGGRPAHAVAPWKIRYALMLGLERVLTDHPPRLASGTELRRHQIDALAGMLTELISRHEEEPENGTATGTAVEPRKTRTTRSSTTTRRRRTDEEPRRPRERPRRRSPLPLPPSDRLRQDDRRRRVRRGGAHDGRPHPHAPPPPRSAVHARPDHRGLRRPLPPGDREGPGAAPRQPDHDPDVRVVRAPRRLDLAAAPTSSSSATRRTRRSARRRAPRSAASPSRSTSA